MAVFQIPVPILTAMAGAGSGVITKSCTAPLERVKILLQIQPMTGSPTKYKGMWQSCRLIVAEEGVRGLFLGNFANCVRVIPVYALKFAFNDSIRELFRNPGQVHLTWAQMMGAGTIAGLFQTSITYPLELIRSRLSMGRVFGNKYGGMVDCARQVVKAEGVRGLYKGVSMTWVSGAPYVGLQMSCYDVVRRNLPTPDNPWENLTWTCLAGAVSGLIGQTICYPGDVIRRRLQADGIFGRTKLYKGNWDCAKTMLKTEGPTAFFLGVRTNLVRCLPSAAIQFAAYDFWRWALYPPEVWQAKKSQKATIS
jgi:hypothetical protein